MDLVHVVLTAAGREVEFDLTFDPSFVSDVAIQTLSQRKGPPEPELLHVLARVLREGDIAIDVGANVGYFTIVMANFVGLKGRVFAFEPGPQNKAKLADNIRVNKLGNVEVVHKVLWHESTEMTFHLAHDSGLNSLAPSEVTLSSAQVRTATLDDYKIATLSPHRVNPRLLKIDAEGAEEHILRGARQMLSQGIDYVICELNEAALQRLNSSQETLRDYMLLRGYSTFLIREDGGLPIMVPEKTRILPRLNCSLVMFTSPSNVGAAWPEVGT